MSLQINIIQIVIRFLYYYLCLHVIYIVNFKLHLVSKFEYIENFIYL